MKRTPLKGTILDLFVCLFGQSVRCVANCLEHVSSRGKRSMREMQCSTSREGTASLFTLTYIFSFFVFAKTVYYEGGGGNRSMQRKH